MSSYFPLTGLIKERISRLENSVEKVESTCQGRAVKVLGKGIVCVGYASNALLSIAEGLFEGAFMSSTVSLIDYLTWERYKSIDRFSVRCHAVGSKALENSWEQITWFVERKRKEA